MSGPPVDRFEFWVRFCFACAFFGFVLALVVLKQVHDWGVAPSAAAWLGGTAVASYYAARVGDAAWSRLMNWIRWW